MKKLLRKEKFLIDIIIFGSALKSKDKPNDIDICIILRNKDYAKSEEIIYKITKLGEKTGINIHCEPIIVDYLHKKRLYRTLLHEGFSVSNSMKLSELLNFKSYVIMNYSLKNKNNSQKVMFSYALYGRNKGVGLLKDVKGVSLGKGSILIPVEKIEIVREFLKQWSVQYKEKNALVFS